MITMSHEEVLETIPFMFVCETREGARWNSGTRRRLWNEQFTKQEQAACARLFKMAMSGRLFAVFLMLFGWISLHIGCGSSLASFVKCFDWGGVTV